MFTFYNYILIVKFPCQRNVSYAAINHISRIFFYYSKFISLWFHFDLYRLWTFIKFLHWLLIDTFRFPHNVNTFLSPHFFTISICLSYLMPPPTCLHNSHCHHRKIKKKNNESKSSQFLTYHLSKQHQRQGLREVAKKKTRSLALSHTHTLPCDSTCSTRWQWIEKTDMTHTKFEMTIYSCGVKKWVVRGTVVTASTRVYHEIFYKKSNKTATEATSSSSSSPS